MQKARLTITAVIEYDLEPWQYDKHHQTPEGMLEVDIGMAKNWPDPWLERKNAKITVKGELL